MDYTRQWTQIGQLSDYAPVRADRGLRDALTCDSASIAVIAESSYGAMASIHDVADTRSIATARRLTRAMLDTYGAEVVYLALYMSGSFVCALTADSIL